jgi:hypothetical protein
MNGTTPVLGSAKPLRPWNMPMSRDQLRNAGCGPWDDELLLFPVAWFDEIPDGFMVQTILGVRLPFSRANASRDTRYNFLAFGVVP